MTGRLLTTLVLVAGVLLLPPTASGQVPTRDSVTGVSQPYPDAYDFVVDAHSGPSGEDPSGTAFLVGGGFQVPRVGGPVTCLAVSGRSAILVVKDESHVFEFLKIEVVDNEGVGAPDTFELRPFVLSQPDCDRVALAPGRPLASGDIVVVDAPPLPTSIDQCKNGGWQRYGFENQGRCLVFVLTARVCRFLEGHGHKPKFCPPRPPDSPAGL